MNHKKLYRMLERGFKNPRLAAKYLAAPVVKGPSLTLSSRLPIGTNVFARDWDLLLVLDTCRLDTLRAVADEYHFLSRDGIEHAISVGSATPEWTAATFTEEYTDVIADTALISANGWPYRILNQGFRPEDRHNASFMPTKWGTVSAAELGNHIPAWQYGDGRAGWSNQPQADAETVSDLAITTGRTKDFDRVIAHLIEPHYPFAAAARKRGAQELSEAEQSPWEFIRTGGDKRQVMKNYVTELKFGLDNVERILENFDADRVLITADHGECFGEWFTYGHSSGSFNPTLRRVPICWTSATDERTYEPPKYRKDVNRGVEENLESLGYL